MAHDVAHCIYQLAKKQEDDERALLLRSSKRVIRFEAYASVTFETMDDGQHPQVEMDPIVVHVDVRAPTIVLHRAGPVADHWYIRYEGTEYDLDTFPQGVSFVLRCVVDSLLCELSEALSDNAVDDTTAKFEVELCASVRFGTDNVPPSSSVSRECKSWSHTFGRLFRFGDTYEESYEDVLQRYILSTGKHIVAAAKEVVLSNKGLSHRN
jgi:hypothetical protein